ncbi:hypothetical protein [Nocardia testacea]
MSAELTVVKVSELALYEFWPVLSQQAAYGDRARKLIETALNQSNSE